MSEPKLTEVEIQAINAEALIPYPELWRDGAIDKQPRYDANYYPRKIWIECATIYTERAKAWEAADINRIAKLLHHVDKLLHHVDQQNGKVKELEALLKSKDDRWEEVRKQVIVYRDGIKLDLLDKHTPLAEVTALRIRVEETEKWLSLLSDKIDSQPKPQ